MPSAETVAVSSMGVASPVSRVVPVIVPAQEVLHIAPPALKVASLYCGFDDPDALLEEECGEDDFEEFCYLTPPPPSPSTHQNSNTFSHYCELVPIIPYPGTMGHPRKLRNLSKLGHVNPIWAHCKYSPMNASSCSLQCFNKHL